MEHINNTNIVKEQYQNSDKLNTRMSLHQKYSTNKMGFGNWIFTHYKISPDSKILELGCGTGDMWKPHLALLGKNNTLTLTDFSEGMLETTRDTLGIHSNITYQVVDIQNIPYIDNSFDLIIANMMLYHVPDLNKGLSEVKRVLKDSGTFYCATYGEHGIIDFISKLLSAYDVTDCTNKVFTLQNGKGQLAPFFAEIKRINYEDSLKITELEDILDYIYSCTGMTNISSLNRATLKALLESKMENGVLHIPKEYGMFICKNN